MRRQQTIQKKLKTINKQIKFNELIGKRGRDSFAAGNPFLYEQKRTLEWVLNR
jgi:hypothetical protein